jgi:hypothetical protein
MVLVIQLFMILSSRPKIIENKLGNCIYVLDHCPCYTGSKIVQILAFIRLHVSANVYRLRDCYFI